MVPDWKDSLPEEIRGDPILSKIGGVDALARGYIHAQKMVGGTKVTIPGKNATPEHWAEFWNKIGRPEKPDDYELPKDGLPEGVTFPDDVKAAFFKEAHEAGLTKQQAARLLRFEAERQASIRDSASKQYEESQAKAVADLRREFGKAFDQNIGLAKKIVDDYGGDELREYLNESGLGNDPRLIRAFVKIGKAVASDEIIGTGSRTKFTLSPGEAKDQINTKMRDPQFLSVWQNRNAFGHDEAVKELNDLYEIAYPSGQA